MSFKRRLNIQELQEKLRNRLWFYWSMFRTIDEMYEALLEGYTDKQIRHLTEKQIKALYEEAWTYVVQKWIA